MIKTCEKRDSCEKKVNNGTDSESSAILEVEIGRGRGELWRLLRDRAALRVQLQEKKRQEKLLVTQTLFSNVKWTHLRTFFFSFCKKKIMGIFERTRRSLISQVSQSLMSCTANGLAIGSPSNWWIPSLHMWNSFSFGAIKSSVFLSFANTRESASIEEDLNKAQ